MRQQIQHTCRDEETSELDIITSTEEHTLESSHEEPEMSSTAMDIFLEAQAEFLRQQAKFVEDEEARKKEVHSAQLKELEERSKLLKLQEVQNKELKTQQTLPRREETKVSTG